MPHSMRVLSCSLSGTSARGGAVDSNSWSRPPPHLRPASRSSRSRSITVVARGGGNPFGGGGGGGEGRLIIPGQQGGAGGRGGGGGASGGRLIIPGQGARPGRGGGPGGGPGGGTAPGRGGGPADSPSVFGSPPPPPPPGASPIGVTLDAPSTANFRPPPGFMEAGAEASWILGTGAGGAGSSADEPFDVETALAKVRARAGPWHQLAALLPRLSAAGIDAMAVELETGLERATQALWQTAAQVFASLRQDEQFPAAALPAFDSPPGAPALHELRNLPADARRGAAEYLATGGDMMEGGGGVLEQVDAELAGTLARAYREWERRAREREGFSGAPGDVLAYKHWRDAAECRREEDKEKALKKGLAVAVSGAAKERLESLSTEAIARVVPAAEAAAAAAAAGLLRASGEGGGKLLPITISRLQPSDTLFVPVPLLSMPLGSATQEALAALPTARPSGPFGAFGGGGGGGAGSSPSQFVVLPSWTTVQGLSGLAAIPIDDLSVVPEIVAAAVVASGVVGAKKVEEEREKLRGPGLLVVDRDGGAKARARSAGSGGVGPSGVGAAVLAAASEAEGGKGGGALAIRDVEGVSAAGGKDSAATVLFVVRPPRVSVITESDSGTASFEM